MHTLTYTRPYTVTHTCIYTLSRTRLHCKHASTQYTNVCAMAVSDIRLSCGGFRYSAIMRRIQIFGYHAADSDIRLSCGGSKQSAIMRRIQTFGYLVADPDIRLEGGNLICFPVYLMLIS